MAKDVSKQQFLINQKEYFLEVHGNFGIPKPDQFPNNVGILWEAPKVILSFMPWTTELLPDLVVKGWKLFYFTHAVDALEFFHAHPELWK